MNRTTFLLLMLTLTGAFGCRTAQPPPTTFAQAGATYAEALDRLLIAAAEVQIDSHSEELIARRSLLGDPAPDSFSKRLTELNTEDEARLEVIRDLRQHARLLGRYFAALTELATSGEPAKTSESIAALSASLNELGESLRGNQVVKVDVAPVAKLIVGTRIRNALSRELSAREAILRRELDTQSKLLHALAAVLRQNLATSKNHRMQRLVIDRIVPKPPANPDQWMTDRRRLLTADLSIDQLADASAAAETLKEAFESLVTGGDARAQLDAFLTDAEALIAVLEGLQTEGQP